MPPRIQPSVRLLLAVAFVFLMLNLDALIDSVHHPEIPYFDAEHFITGGVIAIITGMLLGLLELYIRRLERALENVKTLEGMLPICSSCKKIRTPDNEWHVIEKYIKERTDATFTHGICPECMQQRYGHLFDKT
jgi:hypothetical protein